MNDQLEAVARDFERALERLRALGRQVPAGEWARQPAPARWSVAECITHLNLTSLAFLPLLRDAIARARGDGARAPRRYYRDPIGWLLWTTAGPPVRLRVRTTAPFVPAAADPPDRIVAEFERLQAEQLDCVRQSDGLPVDRVKIVSPFNARLKYNLYAALSILPRHQHRHLWQAEQARATLEPQVR